MRYFWIAGALAMFLYVGNANALTVDEIVKLKQAGVSDETIQLLIEREGDAKSAGVWTTRDGWRVHTTEVRPARRVEQYPPVLYPLWIAPRVFAGRR